MVHVTLILHIIYIYFLTFPGKSPLLCKEFNPPHSWSSEVENDVTIECNKGDKATTTLTARDFYISCPTKRSSTPTATQRTHLRSNTQSQNFPSLPPSTA